MVNLGSRQILAIVGFVGFVCIYLSTQLPLGLPNLSFVQRNGSHFVVDGKPFYINGWNSYWLMAQAVDFSTRSKVKTILRRGASMGMTVCRTWAFNDAGYQALQVAPGKYDEDVFQALDYVLVEARRNRVRLLLSLANNLDAFGGKGQYVRWAHDAGVDVGTSNDTFFSNPHVMKYYKAHIKAILTRVNSITGVAYRDDPTIFAWELMNEPRCPSDPSGDTLQALDSKHLVTIGLEGFYGTWSSDRLNVNPGHWADSLGSDFLRNHQISSVDFASVHVYPDNWTPDLNFEDMLKELLDWVSVHIQDGAQRLDKPVLFTEFGLSASSKGFEEKSRNLLFKTMYEEIYGSAKSVGAAAGSMVWQLVVDGLEEFSDTYAFIPWKERSTYKLMVIQSCRLKALFDTTATRKSRSIQCGKMMVDGIP
ncbi:hypothetical protein O6H91_09G027700 [Diphasiastrum complanatum]|uniref:Uncharacterized protein n=1 Tax=Diphasiastrum complanatum TaxID=34168 RepID=A0ACC2CN85_DIPCM|nr:hypothetical protein O6H91_09G027700 [Diphasiastrum complanatum]